MNNIYKTEEITSTKGNKFKIELSYDERGSAPWEECDGHGEVSEWTSRDKRPNEVILCSDRHYKRFYDMQGAIKTAKRDGWGSCDSLDTDTKGQKAVKAAQADYEYLRAWCDNNWWYAVLHVVLVDEEGEYGGYDEYLGGVEDGYFKDMEKYPLEIAQDLICEIEYRLENDKDIEQTSALHAVKDNALFQAGII